MVTLTTVTRLKIHVIHHTSEQDIWQEDWFVVAAE